MLIVLSHNTMQDDWRSSCPMCPCKWQKKQLKQETCSPRKQQCMDQNVKHNCRLLSVETCARSINLFYESVVHCWKWIASIQLNPTLHDLLWFMHWSSLHRQRLLNSFQHLMSSKRIIGWVFYMVDGGVLEVPSNAFSIHQDRIKLLEFLQFLQLHISYLKYLATMSTCKLLPKELYGFNQTLPASYTIKKNLQCWLWTSHCLKAKTWFP